MGSCEPGSSALGASPDREAFGAFCSATRAGSLLQAATRRKRRLPVVAFRSLSRKWARAATRGPSPSMPTESTLVTLEEAWEQWPRCPQCSQPRQCACPACQVAGVDFPLAEYQAASAPLHPTRAHIDESPVSLPPTHGRPLLRCTTCDEVFAPRFYRRCQNCGHDFGEGIDLETAPQEELTPRFFLLLAGMLLTLGVLLVYFWWILRR